MKQKKRPTRAVFHRCSTTPHQRRSGKSMALVEFRDVSRVYRNGDHEQRALDHVNLSLEEGKFIVVLGPSGAGKSTLLNMLGGLDSPTEGTIVVKTGILTWWQR